MIYTQSTKECGACKLDLSTAIRVRNEDSWINELAQTWYVGSETQHAPNTHKHLPNGITFICTLCIFLSLSNCFLSPGAHRLLTLPIVAPLNEVSDMHQVFMPAAPLFSSSPPFRRPSLRLSPSRLAVTPANIGKQGNLSAAARRVTALLRPITSSNNVR